ncbi:IS110 family transposase [bacterium]|nr:IS110 family transposase [bacterium]
MNLYQTQHPFYCGIDLHANQMYACVIDSHGKKLLHRNFKTRQANKFFEQIEPFSGVAIGCESTFNWYWLADACGERNIPFVLGHALYLKAIHGGKVKNDKLDSEKLALLLRGGNFATAYAYPKELRATRDLLRRRTHFVRLKAQTLTHLQIVNHQHNFDPFEKKITYKSNRIGLAGLFDEPSVKASVGLDVRLADFLHEEIRKLELHIEQAAKVDDPQSLFRLQTIPGVGRILAMTMLYEIHDIKRFPTVGQFLSYCRLVKGSHTSAGKSYGSPGKKIGNAHLKWAFSEGVPLLKRCSPEARAFVDRIEKKRGKARAFSYLAVKLGRAVYYMLKRGEAFELDRMLR